MIQDAITIILNLHFGLHEQIAVGFIAFAAFMLGRLTRTGAGDKCSASMFDGLTTGANT